MNGINGKYGCPVETSFPTSDVTTRVFMAFSAEHHASLTALNMAWWGQN